MNPPVKVRTGAVSAMDDPESLPIEKWDQLVRARYRYLTINLPSDCSYLLQFVHEAERLKMWEKVDHVDMATGDRRPYKDMSDFISNAFELDPEKVQWAINGFRMLKPNEKLPYSETCIKILRSAAVPSTSPPNWFTWADEFCSLPPSESWLIRDYLEPDSLCVLYGDSETFKSFLAVDICGHIATGNDWRGKQVKPGIALYVAGEGGNGLRKRFKAWFEHRQLQVSRNIGISTVPISVCDPANVAMLVQHIKTLLNEGKQNPSLIVLDTLNTHFGEGDENSTADMTKFVRGIRDLRIETGACVLVVHHCGHGAKDRGRGSIALRSGIDWEYRLERTPETKITTLYNTKAKDADRPPVLSWQLETVPLPWADSEGNPLFSAVLVPTEYVEQVKVTKLGDKQQQAFDILKRLYEEHRQNLIAGGLDPNSAKVAVKHWSTAMITVDSDSGNRANIRKALIKRKLVEESDYYVKPL